ncbi:hypothetical protein [Clostridium cochlearium]|uniref:hypothetical protein n=1 Tax=Clostridium cochlearium TaxID=1494 RepID=UPI00156FF870|nr:hypothetical protein [Clostridium cochlearium]MBV1819044.1 hypothetical protein [Bacteroidales bacterium MSK.15.36]MCG4580643.1 hypothetical protein [Clostridium cochlearium]NSJ91257.1 hypothetical protein [Coprococcus sp. MSK.21.13]
MNKEISKKEQDRIIQGALRATEELKNNMNKYFKTVDKHFETMDKNINKYFENMDKNIDKLDKSLRRVI